MRVSTEEQIVGIALAAVAVTVAGVGYAHSMTNGDGTATGGVTTAGVTPAGATTAGVAGRLVFSQDALQPLFPGDDPQTLSVEVTNASAGSAYVGHVRAYVRTTRAGCTGADFLLGGTPAPSTAAAARELDWTPTDLAADGSATATSTFQFRNTDDEQDACKGAVVTVHYLAG